MYVLEETEQTVKLRYTGINAELEEKVELTPIISLFVDFETTLARNYS